MYLRLMYTLIYLAISSLFILWSDYFPFCCCHRSIFYQTVVPLEFCFKLALNRWQKDCDWWFNNLRSHELSAHNDFESCALCSTFTAKRILERLGIQILSPFVKIWYVCIPNFKANFLIFWRSYGLVFYLETIEVY